MKLSKHQTNHLAGVELPPVLLDIFYRLFGLLVSWIISYGQILVVTSEP